MLRRPVHNLQRLEQIILAHWHALATASMVLWAEMTITGIWGLTGGEAGDHLETIHIEHLRSHSTTSG